ncbi:MAG: hypothetical protein IJS73_07815 [Paludibacteraceae bacterium]|nr:hypothetical protein [Paludibacteraceae bacterium]
MKFSKIFAISAIAVLAMSFTACKKSSENDEDSKIKSGSQEALNAACEQWKESRQYWEWSEAFLFGPATTYSIDPHTDTWPFAKTQFESLMQKYNPATNDDDAAFIDEYIAKGESSAGFHAVEYILFRNGQPRQIADLTEDEVYYAKSAAKDLRLAAIKLVAAWGGDISKEEQEILDEAEWEAENNYGESHFLNQSGTQAAKQIIAGCSDIIGEVADSKIASAYKGEDTNYIESPHAYNSIQDFYDNIISCQNALYGKFGATKPESNSLIAYTNAVPQMAEQSKKVQDALKNALDKIQEMKKPFVLNYTDASCGVAIEALHEFDDELAKLEELLSKYENDATQNAELKKVAEKYYKDVVLATYRGLADNGKKLADRVDKIAE